MGLSVDVLDRWDAFERVRGEWDRAVAASADASIFLTWGWLRCCWEHFAARRNGARLHVVLVRAGDDLVAGLPLARVRVGVGPRAARATALEPLTHRSGDYGGAVLVRRYDDAVNSLLGHLADELRRGVAGVTLSRLMSDSVFLATLRRRVTVSAGTVMPASAPGPVGGNDVVANGVVLDEVWRQVDVLRGYDLRKYGKKHHVGQRLRRLREHHDVSFRYHTGDGVGEGMRRLLDLFRRRWLADGDRGWRPSFLTDAHQRAHLLDTVRAADAGGWLRLLTLTADGRPVAAELGFEYGGTHHLFRGSFDPAFARYGPSQLMICRVLEDGIARGVREFDFMRGDHPYKRRWTNAERRVVTINLTRPGLAGRLGAARLRIARSCEARFSL